MSDDPFKPADSKTETQATEATASPADDVKNSFSIGFTLKAGTGYEAEWVTPKVFGASAEETAGKAKALLEQMRDQGVFELAAGAAQHTRNQYQGKAAHQSRPQNNNGGQQRQYKTQDSAGGGKTCQHGEMVFRSGTNQAGKPWKGYFCPSPKGTPDQCDVIWVK